MLCNPALAVMRPAAPSDPDHDPRSRPSGPTCSSSQANPNCGEDAFSATPREQRFHDRVSIAERLKSPGPRVSGTSMPTRRSSDLTWSGLRRSKVIPGARWLQHVVISTLQLSGRFGRIAGAGTDEPGDD